MAILQGAITIALFILILGGLVVIHEVGHFVLARLFGIRVLEFGIGFPPRAKVLRAKGETLYTLNWLPIGGCVRLDGEDGDSEDPRSFAVQRLWKKLVVLLAGVGMNLVLAFAIFFGIAWLATPQGGLTFAEVQAGSPAEAAGLEAEETILAIDGATFDLFPSPDAGRAAIDALRDRAGETVTLTVKGVDGAVREVQATLRTPSVAADQGALGIRGAQLVFTGEYRGRDILAAIGAGAAWTVAAFTLILNGLADLLASIVSNPGQAPPVSGPVGIAVQVGDVFWQLGPIFTLYLAGLLSANLALVNVLPFPPLDGGRMLVLLLKALFGTGGRLLRAAGVRVNGPSAATTLSVERLTYLVGFVFLFGFLIWITYFDIVRQVSGGTP
ncbi:MAG TPA: site-2 protease family protein [Candidatus Nanopelagicales bacterium]|nr:site-2 protease family protein [Candidatus Nanopelagicales bacterium]